MNKTVLMEVFGPNKEELREGWRKFRNDVLGALKSSPNMQNDTTRWVRWGRACDPYTEIDIRYENFGRKTSRVCVLSFGRKTNRVCVL